MLLGIIIMSVLLLMPGIRPILLVLLEIILVFLILLV